MPFEAKVEISYDKLQETLGKISAAEQEAAALRQQLVDEKLRDPSERVAEVTAFARDCLTVARFAVANLPPEMIKGWPYEELRRIGQNIGKLPDCSISDRDMGIDLVAFARECEAVENERRRR